MRKKNLSILFVFFLILTLVLHSQASATKSRLSSMGDLSIVIEDESNMINLWDFAGNPAGFLEDEKGSVIRGDFIWDTYQIKNLLYYTYQYAFPNRYRADGDIFNNWISLGFRKKDGLALGVEGNYFSHQIDSKYQKNKNTSPKILLVFTRRLDPLTSFGSSLRYLEDKRELRYKTYPTKYRRKVKDFQAEIGMARKLSSEVTLGATLGYDSFKPSKEPEEKVSSYVSDSYGIWLSGQTCVEIEKKLKLGLETTFRFKRAEFQTPYFDYIDVKDNKRENYYYSYLRFRGIYELSSRLKVGLFYFDNELFGGFFDPYDMLFLPLTFEPTVRHFGGGCSYQINKKVLAGIEYHLSDSSDPEESNRIFGWKSASLNFGVEGEISEGFSLRGGFIRTETSQNPNFSKRRESWENIFTSGFGYQPYRRDFTLEFSYRYAFKKFKRFYGNEDIKSDRHIFALSLKKTF